MDPVPSDPILPDDDPLTGFLSGRSSVLCVEPDGGFAPAAPRPKLLLPGSFNPLHDGHLGMAQVASERTRTGPAFELTVVNADKPPLSADEVRRRLGQFVGRGRVWLTHAATFAAKARLFPGATFVVGADTAARIVAPRFYGDSAGRMDEALEAFRALGCRFLVAGRLDATGVFLGLEQLTIPERHRDLFGPLPFRLDISSTQLRQKPRTEDGGSRIEDRNQEHDRRPN